MSELTYRAKRIIDNDKKFILVAFNDKTAEVICKLSDDVYENLGCLDTAIECCEGLRDTYEDIRDGFEAEQEESDDVTEGEEALTLSMLKLTALAQINPEIEPYLTDVCRLIAKARTGEE